MRVDLLGRYSEIQRQFEARRQPKVGEGEFVQTLDKVSQPGEPKSNLISGSYQSRSQKESAIDDSPLARLDPRAVAPQAPVPERISLPQHDVNPLPLEELPVKQTTLEAPRVDEAKRAAPLESKSTPKPEEKREGLSKMEKLVPIVTKLAAKQGIDPALSLSVISQESAFDHTAVSSDGHESKGLFQLLDSTGQGQLDREGSDEEYDPFNPELNIQLGTGYLRYLHEIFSQDSVLTNKVTTRAAANSSSLEKLAVAAFNAGEGRVAWAQERATRDGKNPSHYDAIAPYLPESTQQYVSRVVEAKQRFVVPHVG